MGRCIFQILLSSTGYILPRTRNCYLLFHISWIQACIVESPSEFTWCRRKPTSGFVLFRKSRFYVSVLLIITFILFMVAPDLTYLIIGIVYNNPSESLLNGCWICYALPNLADGYIYIFVQDNVRKAFCEKILFCFRDKVEPVLYLSSLRLPDWKMKIYTVSGRAEKKEDSSERIISEKQSTVLKTLPKPYCSKGGL